MGGMTDGKTTGTTKSLRTDAQVRAIRCPAGVTFCDAYLKDPQIPGLHVRVFATGRKVFCLVYRHLNRQHRLKLGLYSPPEFGLADARQRAKEVLATITQGDDPATERAEMRRTDDVRSLYARFETEVVRRFPAKTQANWHGTMARILPEIGQLPITATDEICTTVMDLHKRVGLDQGKEALGRRIFQHTARLFRWAIEERKLKPSQFPLAGMRSRFKDKKRTRYYDPDEIRRLFEGIASAKPADRCFFQLLWYTGSRRGALASLKWSEIRPDHSSPGEWLWYRQVSKNGDPLEVPLSSHAMRVLEELRATTGDGTYVFPSQRADGVTGHRSDSWKPVERLRADSAVTDFANHDIRRTISTYLTRTLDVPTDVVTAILNHRLSGPKANENYVQALPVRRMRAALEAWGQYLHDLSIGRPEPSPRATRPRAPGTRSRMRSVAKESR